MATTASNDWKELASREHDGLVVSLLWSRTADRVEVIVVDAKLDEEFRLDVPGACALDAFYHPFAYAHGRGSCGVRLRAALICLADHSALVPERSADR